MFPKITFNHQRCVLSQIIRKTLYNSNLWQLQQKRHFDISHNYRV